LSASDWYRWIAILVLVFGSIFFLFKSIGVKAKNPNELLTFMTLSTILNVFFVYKLIYDAIDIQNNYIDYQQALKLTFTDSNACDPGVFCQKALTLGVVTFWLALVGIFGCVLVLVLVYMTTLPLRDGIYEEIFWQIGGNANVLEQHKARTQFVASLEIDFFVMFEFSMTLGFYCYDLQIHKDTYGLTSKEMACNWAIFGFFAVVSLLNNIHGYFILQTVDSTFNSKFYFFIRVFIQLCLFYLGVMIYQKRQFIIYLLQNVPVNGSDELFRRSRFYTVLLLAISVFVGTHVIYSARNQIKIKRRTEINAIRTGAGYGAGYASLGASA